MTHTRKHNQKTTHLLSTLLFIAVSIFIVYAPFGRRFAKIAFAITAFLWVVLNIICFRRKCIRGLIPSNPLNYNVFFFLLVALLSTLLGKDPYHSQGIFFERYIPFLVFFWLGCGMVTQFFSRRHVEWLFFFFLLGGIIFGAGGMRDYFVFHPHRLFTFYGRQVSFKMFPLFVTYYIPFSCAVLFMLKPKNKKEWMYVIAALISLVVLIPCWIWQSSRFSWVAVIGAVCIAGSFKNRKVLFAILCVLAASFFILNSQLGLERAQTAIDVLRNSDRIAIGRAAIDMFYDYPVLGAGVGMFEKLFGQYFNPPPGYERFYYLHAHNLYFEILAEMGALGLVAFIALFAHFFIRLVRVERYADSMYKALCASSAAMVLATLLFGVGNSIIVVGVEGALLFWLLFGMATGIIHRIEQGTDLENSRRPL